MTQYSRSKYNMYSVLNILRSSMKITIVAKKKKKKSQKEEERFKRHKQQNFETCLENYPAESKIKEDETKK